MKERGLIQSQKVEGKIITLLKLLIDQGKRRQYTRLHQAVGKYSLILSDLMAFVMSSLLASWLHEHRPDWAFEGEIDLWAGPMASIRVIIFIALILLAIAWFWLAGHYSRRRPFWDELAEVVRLVFILGLLDASFQYLAKLPFSRFWYLGVWVGVLLLIPLLRILTKKLLMRLRIWQRPAIVLGMGRNAKDAAAALHSDRLMGYQVLAFASLSPPQVPSLEVAGACIPAVRFDPSHLEELNALGNPSVIVAFEHVDLGRETRFISRLHHYCDDLHVVPPLRGLPLLGTKVHYFFRHELFFLALGNNLARWGPRVFKRMFDLAVATALLLLALPLFGVLAMLIRRDDGPILFAQERIGQFGVPFPCLKFRTMVPEAQAVLDRLLADDPELQEEWKRHCKLRDDPRITPVGRWLRRYSLDELAQLWNVIKGEMSLVGPRPVVKGELKRYGEDVDYYLLTKPGMTGLWQISGRNDTRYSERVYLDAWYVKNWSLWMDIVILIKTVRVVLTKNGAY